MSQFRKIGENAKNLDALRLQLRTNLGLVPFVGAGFSVPCGTLNYLRCVRTFHGAPARHFAILELPEDLHVQPQIDQLLMLRNEHL